MITKYFPQGSPRYLALPILGPLMERYAGWLHEQQYTWRSARYELRMAGQVADYLERRSVSGIDDLNQGHMDECHRWFRRKCLEESGSVLVLARFLQEGAYINKPPPPLSAAGIQVTAFMDHLKEVRGYVPSTIRRQGQIAGEFLDWLRFLQAPDRLSALTIGDLEGFILHLSKRMGRVGLQKPIAIVRNFLRFLATRGAVPTGLDSLIERPRIYRQEQLPRSLPWPTIEALLSSINRDSPTGKRDYAMFLLMTTYGLRACDVVALTLDDIHWRAGQVHIRQSKTGQSLEFPLIDDVGSAIQDYLKKVPRYGSYRELFLRLKAPGGILRPTAVIEAFQAWSVRSGLEIPFKGAHCIRHSYALNLLRQGTPLKTIGDLMGHRSPDSTTVYLRLATEDLRMVALPLPTPIPVVSEGRR